MIARRSARGLNGKPAFSPREEPLRLASATLRKGPVMAVTLDYNAALKEIAGDGGLDLADLEALAPRSRDLLAALHGRRESGELGFFHLPFATEEAQRVKDWADEAAGRFEAVVHLGIGGSGLGPICIQSALNHPLYNEDAQFRDGRPRLYVVDNADPEMLASVSDAINPEKTLFHVVSKSGTTPETMTAFMFFWEKAKLALGEDKAPNHFVFTTDPKSGVLRALAERDGIVTFNVPPNVGGRFSVLTAVGLLPAALAGIDPLEMLAGAAEMARRCETPELLKNPACLHAAIHWLADTKKGQNIAVMMPYSQALRAFAWWFAQLWGESLGKRTSRQGKTVHVGQTPVAALGATDQHSQVQLYVEGPNDKIFTFLEVERFRHQLPIPQAGAGLEAMKHFGGVDMGDLLNVEKRATEFAIASAGRPSLTWKLDAINGANLGALFYVHELSTAFAGELYDIDAFDQPGVEEGKRATHALLGRGKEEDRKKLAEVEEWRGKFTRAGV
jgi:glucose-6-phosphate isomerase